MVAHAWLHSTSKALLSRPSRPNAAHHSYREILIEPLTVSVSTFACASLHDQRRKKTEFMGTFRNTCQCKTAKHMPARSSTSAPSCGLWAFNCSPSHRGHLTCYWIWYQYDSVKWHATDMNEHWQNQLNTSSTLDRGTLVFNSHHIALKLASNIAEKIPYVFYSNPIAFHIISPYVTISIPQIHINPPSPLSLLFLGVAWHLPNTWQVSNPSCVEEAVYPL